MGPAVKKHRVITQTLLFGFTVLQPLLCLAADFEFKPGFVPEGFEDFYEPQSTVVDVFFGGEYILSTLAEYTPADVTFTNPEQLVESLENLAAPSVIMEALSKPLDSNAGMLCSGQFATNCGSLKPDVLGVIFDESKFRVDLFTHPSMLTVREAYDSNFLPDPSSGNSFLQYASLAYSGDSLSGSRSSVKGLSLYSMGRQRLQSDWALNSDSGLSFDSLFWQKDNNDKVYQGGLFRAQARNLTFIRSDDLLGGRVATAIKTRTDLEFIKGSDVQVFLAGRSRVDLFKGGSLISSHIYAPGNQLIDTSALPEGAYDVDIEIHDFLGGLSKERRFFVKTPKLPPEDFDLFYLEAGDVRISSANKALPKAAGAFTVRGGYSRRLKQNLGIELGGAVIADELAAETGVSWINETTEIQPKLMMNFAGDYGAGVNAFTRYKDWSVSANSRRIWGSDADAVSPDYKLVRGSLKQQSLYISRPHFGGQLSFQSSFTQQSLQPRQESYTLRYSRPLLRGTVDLLDFSAELSSSDSGAVVYARINWNRRKNKWTHRAALELRNEHTQGEGSSTGVRSQFGSQWLDGDKYEGDLLLNFNGELANSSQFLQAESDYRGRLGRVNVETAYANSGGTSSVGMALNYTTSIVSEGGTTAWGGKQFGSSAIVLSIDGDAKGIPFDVLINGQEYGVVEVGLPLIVGLHPYETYKVQVRDKGTEFVSFDGGLQEVTLFPGNVKTLSWSADSINVVLGQAFIKEAGCDAARLSQCLTPVKNARIEGAEGLAFVDQYGYFQVELNSSQRTLVMKKKGLQCTVHIPDYKAENGLVYLDKLLCEP